MWGEPACLHASPPFAVPRLSRLSRVLQRLAWVAAAAAILGCATPRTGTAPVQTAAPAAPEAAKTADGVPEVPVTSALMYQLMAAELAAQQGELGAAYSIYLKVARETRDPRLARRATELALQGRALPESTQAAELWRELAPTSREASQALALLYASSGRFDDAYGVIAPELKTSATPAQELARLQRQLARVPDRAGGFRLLERLAQPNAGSAEVRLTIAAGAQAAGLNERATAEARAAVALQPDERTVLAAMPVLQANDRPAALKAMQSLMARPGNVSPEVRLAYARLLVADKQYPAARGQFELLLKERPDDAELVYSLALLSLQGGLNADARTYLLRYLALMEKAPDDDRDLDQTYLYLAQIAEEERQYGEALKWLRKVEGGDEYVPARVREASVLTKMQRPEEARKLLRAVNASTADERVQVQLAEAQLLRETRRYDEALKLLTQAMEKAPDNVALLYDAAMTAEKLDKIDVMERNLRRVIELRPDYAHAYNALGYSLADRNQRLPEALKLIEKAHELAPDDAYILDSLGWVYYRLGDLDKAQKYLQQAYDAKPEAEVAIHLAEVLWVRGDQARARALLREVRAKEPGNELLKSTVARLRIGGL